MMPEPEQIQSDVEYRGYLTEINQLAADDPELGTPDGDRLVLLATLVQDYEKKRFQFKRP